MPPLESKNSDRTSPNEPPASGSFTPASAIKQDVPTFGTLEKHHWAIKDLFRVILIFAGLATAGALIVVLLPQQTVDRIIRRLEARHAVSNPEQIALLYLGDETDGNNFRVRGVIRNITALPIEQLDAIIRLYAHDRTLIETTVVRMSKEMIDPGAISQFELVYPQYGAEFGSYSVEFKLRQGAVMPYRDMRVAPEQPRSD